jgi:hypothetical protein
MTCRTQCYFVGSLHVCNYRVLLFTLSLLSTFHTHSLSLNLTVGDYLPGSTAATSSLSSSSDHDHNRNSFEVNSYWLLLLVAPSLPQMSHTIAPSTTPLVGGHLVGKQGQIRNRVNSRGGRDCAWGGWWWNGIGPARGHARRERTNGQGGGASKEGTHGGCAP